MSTEVTLYPKSATKNHLKRHLISLVYVSSGHPWDWPKGSIHFYWFETEDFKSIDGVEATLYPPSEKDQQKFGRCHWALHTRTRASGSVFEKSYQNHTIRTARKLFGGTFYNDWYGVNRYTPLWKDDKGPIGRGIFSLLRFVIQSIRAVEHKLPPPTGALLRREGLYWSNLSNWRKQRESGELAGLSRKRGPEHREKNPLSDRVRELERENGRLKRRAERAEGIVELQKKVSEILGIELGESAEKD